MERMHSLPPNEDRADGFTITLEKAYVAAATSRCWKCGASIEVICIYCETGRVSGEELTRFTVSNVWAMDDTLARQLAPWPDFRMVLETDAGCFTNHCGRCGAPQDDLDLHSEPDQPFFNISGAQPGSIRLTALEGPAHLSGDESFEV